MKPLRIILVNLARVKSYDFNTILMNFFYILAKRQPTIVFVLCCVKYFSCMTPFYGKQAHRKSKRLLKTAQVSLGKRTNAQVFTNVKQLSERKIK